MKNHTAKHCFLIAIALFISALKTNAQLSGTFTIDSAKSASANNYKNFSSAIADLMQGTRPDKGPANGKGVSGAVVFKVANGVYKEQIEINPIQGASSANTVTFQSALGDSSKVKLTWPASSSPSSNYLLSLDSADWIIFKGMTLQRTGSGSYARVVLIQGEANNNILQNNRIMGIFTTFGSATDQALVYSPGDNDSGNIIKNNLLMNCRSGIYLNGDINTHEKNTLIQGNDIDSISQYCIYGGYQDNMVISSNKVVSGYAASAMGLYLFICNSPVVNSNVLKQTAGSYGFYFFSVSGATGNEFQVYNNFISIDGSTAIFGIYAYGGAQHNYYYNNIRATSSNTTSSAIAFSKITNLEALNNVLYSDKGTALYMSSNSNPNTDYNDYYTSGSAIAYINGSTTSTFSGLKILTTNDAKSVNYNPSFISSIDLHIRNVVFKGKAIPIPGIKYDIDGEIRDTVTPDIGADELNFNFVDGGLTGIDSPKNNLCAGNRNVYVRLVNFGFPTITSAEIAWKVNSKWQTSATWTGSLGSGNLISVKLGSANFSSKTTDTIVAAIRKLNGVLKVPGPNDTISAFLNSGLSGTYTIGKKGDFHTFNAADSALTLRGVCGPVVFNVADGTYTEQISFGAIKGASAINTIKFQSASGDSSKVTLTFPTTSSTTDNYVINLNGTDFITFKEMTISRTGTKGLSKVVAIGGGASNNTLTNNRLIGLINSNQPIISSDGDNDTANVFRNNLLKYAAESIVLYGTSNSLPESGTIIENNIIDSSSMYAILVLYQKNTTIRGNTVTNLINNLSYGIVINNSRAFILSNNRVIQPNGGYGIYLYQAFGTLANPALIFNNFVSIGGTTANTYGINTFYGSYLNFYFNSVNLSSSHSNATSVKFESTQNIDSKNNCFANTGSGISLDIPKTLANYSSDYNNYYATGTYLASINATNISNISSIKTKTGVDKNSISLTPGYFSVTDLHLVGNNLRGKGIPINTTTKDIDGDIRNSTNPDIGADEYYLHDAGMTLKNGPSDTICPDTVFISAAFKNYSPTTLKTVSIGWSVNGVLQKPYNWSGTLAPGNSDTIPKIGNYAFTSPGSTYKLKIWTYLPDGQIDYITSNDTIYSNIIVPISPNAHWGAYVPKSGNISFTADDMFFTAYSWDFGDGSKGSGSFVFHNYKKDSTYSVRLTVTDKRGCTAIFDSSLKIFTGIESSQNATFTAEIYPNPFSDKLRLSITSAKAERINIVLMDVRGREICNMLQANILPGSQEFEYNLESYNLIPGVYFIKLSSDNFSITRRLIEMK